MRASIYWFFLDYLLGTTKEAYFPQSHIANAKMENLWMRPSISLWFVSLCWHWLR